MALYKGTVISVATALVLGATLVVAGWEPDPDEPLPNEVHFPISCSAASQGQFDHAVSLLHSLHYAHAERASVVNHSALSERCQEAQQLVIGRNRLGF